MKKVKIIILLIIFLCINGSLYSKTIYYVTQNGTGNGSNWINAAGNIQTMIDKAGAYDEIWVAKGIYYPTTETIARDARSRTFILKSNNLYGGFAGNETEISQRSVTDLDGNGKADSYELSNQTILSGNIDGIEDVWTKKISSDGSIWSWIITGNENNCYRVVTGTGWYINFDGFTITGGNGNINYFSGGGINGGNVLEIANCTVTFCFANDMGGGIFDPKTITNCKVSNCSASNGGGIYSSNVIVNDCTVSGCSASDHGGGIYSIYSVISCSVRNCSAKVGGGICTGIENLNTTDVLNCTVSDCSASAGGGIISSSVKNCMVSNCTASDQGGGIVAGEVENSTVKSCSASSGGGIISSTVKGCLISNCKASQLGGGIYLGSNIFVVNCTICNCSAFYGGGLYARTSDSGPKGIENCAVFNNSATSGGGGIYFDDSETIIYSCAISNNGSLSIVGGFPHDNINPEIDATFVKPTSFIGVGITDAQKAELLVANWQLRSGSLNINAGTDLSEPTYDLLGNPRIQYGKIDIGAFEFMNPSIILPIIEDFNSWTDFGKSQIITNPVNLNMLGTKWSIENKKAEFSWKTTLRNYSQTFFTYQIDASKTLKVFLKYDMYFEAYAGTITSLGTEELTIEYSIDFLVWKSIASYSNRNGTIPNKTYLHDISTLLAGKTFFLRFNANGENTNRIEKWEIDNIIVDTDGKTTDIKQIKEASFFYSVNNGVLDIQNLKEATKVQLFDVNGKLLNVSKPANNTIQFALPAHGIYIVRTESASGVESKKVVW